MRSRLRLLILALIVLVGTVWYLTTKFLKSPTMTVSAQTNCPQMNVGGSENLTWPTNKTVKVYFGSTVPANQHNCYVTAFNAWSDARTQNGSGVTFVLGDPAGGSSTVTVESRVPSRDPNLRGEVNRQWWNSSGV